MMKKQKTNKQKLKIEGGKLFPPSAFSKKKSRYVVI